MVKDRQNEERQRKLEELKNQAIAAQKYREQKEDERKRRMEELRHKELDRKQQVGQLEYRRWKFFLQLKFFSNFF